MPPYQSDRLEQLHQLGGQFMLEIQVRLANITIRLPRPFLRCCEVSILGPRVQRHEDIGMLPDWRNHCPEDISVDESFLKGAHLPRNADSDK